MLNRRNTRAQTQTVLAPVAANDKIAGVNQARMTVGIALLACLLAAGCKTVPMNYSEWKKAQDDRIKFAQAGIPYKSPSQLRDEAAEMRHIAQETVFANTIK